MISPTGLWRTQIALALLAGIVLAIYLFDLRNSIAVTVFVIAWIVLLVGAITALALILSSRVNRRMGEFVAQSFAGWIATWWRESWATLLIFVLSMPLWNRRATPLLDASGEDPPLLLVHGYVCNGGLWRSFASALRQAGYRGACYTIDLEPAFGDINDFARALDTRVRDVLRDTRSARINLVAHSMGGLVCRAWLAADPRNPDLVGGLVTIGSPHQGTMGARWIHFGVDTAQMRPGSEFLRDLQKKESNQPALPLTAIASAHDDIVFPVSLAVPPASMRADVMRRDGRAHLSLLFDAQVVQDVVAALKAARAQTTSESRA